MNAKVRVLILGTGAMANTHAEAYLGMSDVELVAGIDQQPERLEKFCATHSIKNQFTSIEDALNWGAFDAASNTTPDAVHYSTTLALLDAGKHVLCEKPLATNFADAQQMADKANSAGVVHGVNLSYRDVPEIQHAATLVADGILGSIRHFEASYFQSWLTQPAWGDWKTESKWLWRLSSAHGSNGTLGDVGIHILDMATFIAGSLPIDMVSRLKTFEKAPGNQIGEYTLDANDSFVMQAELPNGALGTVSATRFATGHHNDLRLRIYGDKGGMEVLFEKGVGQLNVCVGDNRETTVWENIQAPKSPSNYERFISAIKNDSRMSPDFFRGAELQQFLDQALSG